MSLLVMGVSHHEAPLALLEAVALDPAGRTRLEADALTSEYLTEAVVVSTCNRTEVYVEARTFHGALADLTAALARVCRVDRALLQPHLYVHYEERGIAHAFTVASGLDSMAVGESQILGQVRRSLARAQRHGHVGPELNTLLQQALRVGKKVHAETGIDAVAGSLVGAAIERGEHLLGPLAERTVAVVGAGGMGALAATTLARHGVGSLLIVNRSAERAHHLAGRVGGTAVAITGLTEVLARADLVISSTGATGRVITVDAVAAARSAGAPPQQVLVDLALPHDIDKAVADLAGISLIGLAELGTVLADSGRSPQVQDASAIVTAEVAAYLTHRSAEVVAPTVTALRARAQEVVASELARLDRRLPELSETVRSEVERTLHRVVDKLMHAPTVKVKELAQAGQGGSYARALSELFDLDPRDVSLVSTPPSIPGEES